MKADLRSCNASSALVEPNGCERVAEPPCVAQRPCCGDCRHFSVLDDRQDDESDWYGVCLLEANDELGVECATGAALDYCYGHGRHAGDEPGHEDCFEEA